MPTETARPESIEEVIDDLLPDELEWRRIVRTYPLPALAVAVVGGFFLGRYHGTEIVEAVTAYARREVSRNVATLFDEAGG